MRSGHCIRKALLRLFTILLCSIILFGVFFGIKGYRMYREATAEKPIEETMEEIRSKEHFTRYSELPQFYIDAVISVEDRRFERHPGIDPIAICRATWVDIQAGYFKQGGSTITQQLVKNQFFTQDKIMERKAAEVFAVFDMEGKYTKEEIFELYVNTIYFGSGHYGIYDASMGYFGKRPSELTDYESVMLAGLPNAPTAYSPDTNMELAFQRVEQVLNSMIRNRLLSQEEADSLQNQNEGRINLH